MNIGQILKLRARSLYFYLSRLVRLWNKLYSDICMTTLYLFQLILATPEKQLSSTVCTDYRNTSTTGSTFIDKQLLFLSFFILCFHHTCRCLLTKHPKTILFTFHDYDCRHMKALTVLFLKIF